MVTAELDAEEIREQVCAAYARVAEDPARPFAVHRGLDYAADMLRYRRHELERLPEAATRRFSGVGNPHRVAPLRRGETLLDVGCGAGTDLLLAAQRLGSLGRAVGVELCTAMREHALAAVGEAGLAERVEVRRGDALRLPVDDASIDVAISNGALGTLPDLRPALRELRRVLRPGGRLQLALPAVQRPLPEDARGRLELCPPGVAGARPEPEIVGLLADAGFVDARVVERFDGFRGTRVALELPPAIGLHGISLYAERDP